MGITCKQVLWKHIDPPRRNRDLHIPESILQMAIKAINDTTGPNGIVPTLLVFGAYPRMALDSPPSATTLKRAAAAQKAMKMLRQLSAERQALYYRSHCKARSDLISATRRRSLPPLLLLRMILTFLFLILRAILFLFLPLPLPLFLLLIPGAAQASRPWFEEQAKDDVPSQEGRRCLPTSHQATGRRHYHNARHPLRNPIARRSMIYWYEVFSFERYNEAKHGNHHIFRSRMVREVKGKETKPYEKSRLVVQGHNQEKTTLLTQSPTIQRVTYPQAQTELFRTILTHLPPN
ncbi:hypothetical protein HRG_014490 [Hirsutella rhossiliensis]